MMFGYFGWNGLGKWYTYRIGAKEQVCCIVSPMFIEVGSGTP